MEFPSSPPKKCFMEINNPTSRPKYNPILMTLSNIIIFGAAYLVMHLYARFFIIYGLMFILVFLSALINIPSTGLLFAGLATVLSIPLFIFVIIDTYIQTKKIVDGRRAVPTKKTILTILGVITVITFFVAYIGTKIFVEMSTPQEPFGESMIETMQEYQEEDRRTKEILTKYVPLQDAHCNSLKKDPTLVVGSFHGNAMFTDYCYFKKAVEQNDPLYCSQFHESLGFNDDCIAYLAIKNQKPELCTEMAKYEISCSSDYDRGTNRGKFNKNPMYYPCSSIDMPDSIKQRCLKEFAEFEKMIELK